MCISGQSRKNGKKKGKETQRNSGAANNEQPIYSRITWYIYFSSSMDPFALSNVMYTLHGTVHNSVKVRIFICHRRI